MIGEMIERIKMELILLRYYKLMGKMIKYVGKMVDYVAEHQGKFSTLEAQEDLCEIWWICKKELRERCGWR